MIDGVMLVEGDRVDYWGCGRCGSVCEWLSWWLPGARPFCWHCWAPYGFGQRDGGVYVVTSVSPDTGVLTRKETDDE